MRLRIKITLLIVISLLIVLVLFNIVTYFTMVRLTTNSQVQLLWNAAKPLMSQPQIYNPERWNDTEWLQPFLMPTGMIRIIDKNSIVRAELSTLDLLRELPADFSSRSFSRTLNRTDSLVIYVQTPIINDKNETLGALQIARQLNTLEQYLGVLVNVLMLTTMGAVLFALASGMYFAKLL